MKRRILMMLCAVAMLMPISGMAQDDGGGKKPKKPVKPEQPQPKPQTDDGESEFIRAHKYFDDTDYQTAVYWLKKAADKGHAIATSDLGLMYEYGIGVHKSIIDAEKYYAKAVTLGYDYAKSFHNRIKAIMRAFDAGGIAYDDTNYIDLSSGNIYFVGQEHTLSRENKLILKYVANQMKESNTEYEITGWHDNYTGTDQSNARIRRNRTREVAKYLSALGVDEANITVVTSPDNFMNGSEYVYLMRVVTIRPKL